MNQWTLGLRPNQRNHGLCSVVCGCSKIHLVVSEDRDREMLSDAERWSRLCSVTHRWMPGVLWLGPAQFVVMRSYRPRRNGHACTVAKEFTRRGVRSDDADHQPPGKR